MIHITNKEGKNISEHDLQILSELSKTNKGLIGKLIDQGTIKISIEGRINHE